jgi:hypothetical protein
MSRIGVFIDFTTEIALGVDKRAWRAITKGKNKFFFYFRVCSLFHPFAHTATHAKRHCPQIAAARRTAMSLERRMSRANRQRRVKLGDDLARWVKHTCKPISEAEAMAALTNGGVIHKIHEHDDCCLTRITGRGVDCICTPRITFYLKPEEAAA